MSLSHLVDPDALERWVEGHAERPVIPPEWARAAIANVTAPAPDDEGRAA